MNYQVLLLVFCVSKSYGYYYWKDFHSKIPLDAYSAGEDINQEQVYIGQAFVSEDHLQGIYTTSIFINKDVYAPRLGVKKPDNFVQILCSDDPQNFEWILTNSTHFHFLKTDNMLVRGGIEEHEWVYIGRLRYQGGTVIGKVVSGNVGSAVMWFVYNENEKRAESYEILTYNDVSNKITLRNN